MRLKCPAVRDGRQHINRFPLQVCRCGPRCSAALIASLLSSLSILLCPVLLQTQSAFAAPPIQRANSESNQQPGGFAQRRDFSESDTTVTRSEKRSISRPDRSSSQPSNKTPRGHVPGGSLWTTLGALVFVVGLILVTGRIWKKHGPQVPGGIPAEAIEILGKRRIDSRQSIHLVRLGSRILVLGSTATGLRTLTEVTDPIEVDYLAGLCRRSDAETSAIQTFRMLFTRRRSVSEMEDHTGFSSEEPATDMPTIELPDRSPDSESGATREAAHV